MIPLYIFLILWLLILGIFLVLALLSILQMLRFGVAGNITKGVTIVFVVLSTIIILGTLIYLSRMDLTQTWDLSTWFQQTQIKL